MSRGPVRHREYLRGLLAPLKRKNGRTLAEQAGELSRNTVERCINRLKQWRGIATRYEKTATTYLAGLHIAGIFLWSAC